MITLFKSITPELLVATFALVGMAAAAAAQAAEAQHRLQSELASARAAHDEALGRAVENEKRIEENARHIAALESRQASEPEPQPAGGRGAPPSAADEQRAWPG